MAAGSFCGTRSFIKALQASAILRKMLFALSTVFLSGIYSNLAPSVELLVQRRPNP
jgi:hypothetical protein